jgi:hypothetical protein
MYSGPLHITVEVCVEVNADAWVIEDVGAAEDSSGETIYSFLQALIHNNGTMATGSESGRNLTESPFCGNYIQSGKP